MSYGQDICKQYLQRLVPEKPMENYRPPWLFGMELDFYFPEAKVAVEFNGDQHYFATELNPDPTAQKSRDYRKKCICKERGIAFIVFKAIDLFSGKIRHRLRKLFALKPNGDIKWLDHEAKQYRLNLIKKYDSPTAHRGYGRRREKTVAKLFDRHPPQLEGKWTSDVFLYNLNNWVKEHGYEGPALEEFADKFAGHLRRRHQREIDRRIAKWDPLK